MITFILTVACTVAIYWLFRGFAKWNVNTTWAITVNYLVAAAFGWTLAGGLDVARASVKAPWFPVVFVMGLCFYPLFQLTARCTQTLGVSVATVATKLSMAIPAVVFLWADGWHEVTWGQAAGLLLAFPAVIISSATGNTSPAGTRPFWKAVHWMPLVMFAGSGGIDLVFGWFAQHDATRAPGMQLAFASVPFTLGGTVGLIHLARSRASLPNLRDVLAGVALGVINFGSLYFLLLVYEANVLGRAMVVPTLNLTVIVVATLGGLLMFRDGLDRQARWGVALATAAIGLMMLVG
jgi:hypothetical protein